jgi:hypothetical protein
MFPGSYGVGYADEFRSYVERVDAELFIENSDELIFEFIASDDRVAIDGMK